MPFHLFASLSLNGAMKTWGDFLQQATYAYFILPYLLTICYFSHCQEIGSNFARVPIEITNLLLARKIARILQLGMSLIFSGLHIYCEPLLSLYPLKNTLKSCFWGCKSIGFILQKMMFYSLKA